MKIVLSMFITFFRSVAVVVIIEICSACNILFGYQIEGVNKKYSYTQNYINAPCILVFIFYTFFILSGCHLCRWVQDIQHIISHDNCDNNCLHFLSDLYSKVINACTTRNRRIHWKSVLIWHYKLNNNFIT